MAGFGYSDAYDAIITAEPYMIEGSATTWRNFAEAVRTAAANTQSTSDTVNAQHGAPYQAFADRASPVATWMNGVAGNADSIATGLSHASTTASSSQMGAFEEDYQYNQDVNRILGPQDALSMGKSQQLNRRTEQATATMNNYVDNMSSAYTAFEPGTIGAAPTTNGGSGATSHAASAPLAGSGTSGTGSGSTGTIRPVGDPAAPQRPNPAANGGTTGAFPNSSVIGTDDPNFAGWVKDPRTGFLIDPATGQEFDPVTGRWIDPNTGKPFGDVVQQAARLEGLTGGTNAGLLAPGLGNVGTVPTLPAGGGGNLPGLFGGLFPPSTSPNNPAARELQQSAMDRMAAKAYAARQLALREASQGGRPYLPPSQGGLAGGPGGRLAPRSRLTTEPESTWTSRNGGRARTGGLTEEELAAGGGRAGAAGRSQRLMPNGGTAGAGAREQSSKKKSRKTPFPGSADQLGSDDTAGDHNDDLADGLGNGHALGTAGLIGATGVAGIAGVAGLARTGAFGGGNGGGQGPMGPGPVAGGAAGRAGGRSRTAGGGAEEVAARGGNAGRRSYVPPMQGGQGGKDRDRNRQRPDWLVEDDIWSAGTQAGPAVLGED